MKNLIRIIKYARKYWGYLIAAMISLVVLTATQLYTPWAVRSLVSLVTNKDPDLAVKALILASVLCALYLLQAFCQFVRSYFTHYAAWHFVSDMRIRVYNHLQKLSLSYYHDKQTGQLMSRTTNDTAALEVLIAHAAPDLIINILILVGVTVVLFSINVYLAAISLISVPFIFILSKNFTKKFFPTARKTQQVLAEFNATLHDNLAGIKEIQVFNQQARESERIRVKSQDYARLNVRMLKMSAYYHPAIGFFNNFGTVLVIGFGGYLAFKNMIPVEDIVAFIMYLGMFYQPVSTLGRVNEDMQNALASAERIFEILDTESDVKEAPGAIDIGKASGNIRFENVSFQYTDGIDVLKDINLEIRPGEMVALVGPTGVGKTTMVSLIARFYDPTSGRITLDGRDLRDITLKSLRDNISIVLQDVYLFNGTVAENIAYGVKEATMEQIIEAAKVANAHEFIVNLADGYNTVIGERGIKLSGGQKQRISIARAVLRNAPILILDEATASVDVETEKLIHDAIDKVIQNRTTIVIAHRLSSVQKADKIVVLNQGRIEEIGTHEELLKKGGLYSHLCSIQLKNGDGSQKLLQGES